MASMDILGGIGAGLMKGTEIVSGLQNQRDQKAYRDGVLENQNAQAKRLQEKHQADLDETARQTSLTGIYQKYADKDMNDLDVLDSFTAEAKPYMKPQEIAALSQTRGAVLSRFGQSAIDKALYANDLSGLQRVVGAKADLVRGEGGTIIARTPDGKEQPFMDLRSLSLAMNVPGAIERLDAIDKAKMDKIKYQAEFNKTNAETDRIRADAELKRATAAGNKGKGADGALSFEDFGKAIAHYIPDGEEFNKADAYQLYLNAVESTNADRARRGLPSMTDGQTATLFSDVIDVARGKGVRTPNIGRDGNLALTADINGRTYTLDPDFTERQALELKDAEGKPRYTSESINDLYLDALRGSAVANPEEFKGAWLVANDPEVRSAIEQEAQKGSPEAIRALQAASTIMRGMDRARETAKVSDRSNWFADKPAPTFSDSERAAAAQLGVDPDRRGLGSYIAEGARKVGDAVGRVASAANRNFVENTQRKIRNTGRIEQGDAIAIVQHIRNTPELKSLFNDDELAAIQVAAQERI